MIHPTSVFATDPEVLLLPQEESRDMGNAIWTLFQRFSDQTCFAVERFTFIFYNLSISTVYYIGIIQLASMIFLSFAGLLSFVTH